MSKGDNRPDKTKEKQAFWLRTIEEIEQHPGSISSFLQERGLASGSLWYWEKRLMKDGLTAGISAAKRSPFLPVEVVAKEDVELLQKQSRLSTETWRIEIRAGKGNTIFFPCDTHVDTLIRFVNGLED